MAPTASQLNNNHIQSHVAIEAARDHFLVAHNKVLITHAVNNLMDITERKQAEIPLQEKEEMLARQAQPLFCYRISK